MKLVRLKIIAIFFLTFIIVSACSNTRFSRSASKAYEIGEYYDAIQKFIKASRSENDPEIKLQNDYYLANAYWYIDDYKKAETRLRNLTDKKYPDSTIVLKYAHALRYLGKYDQAITYYEQFLTKAPDNKEALNGIESCKLTPEWEKNPTRFQVDREPLLNSRDADFSPAFIGGLDNSIIFTSMRDGSTGKKKSAITGQRNGDLFKSNFDIQKQKWSKPTILDEDQNINTNFEEGASSLSKDGSTLYFTRCRFEKNGSNGAEIFSALRSKDAWSEANEIELLSDSTIAAHPSISADGQTLYFVSDMDGGLGGKDIWKVEKLSEDWGKPENMGPEINTPGDEMFPFIRDNGELYFASDFHVGMGGLDIFKATYVEDKEKKTGKWTVENMKSPINSTGDDFSVTFLPGKDQGMFASNRKGSTGDDLYSFILPPKIFRVEGEIVNSETENTIPNAYLRIIGTDGTMLKVRSEDGKFQFRMIPETDYIFAAFKDGFLNAKQIITTNKLPDSKNFDVKLILTPTDSPIKVDNINYEFGKADLTPGSTSALDSIIEILTLNPTIIIEIMSHTDFVGSVQYNSELSQRRAQSAVNYLIQKGINPKRLVAKGYGETWPKKVTKKMTKQYDFLKSGDELTEDFILKLTTEQQEIAKAINRRTEFRVLSNDFRESYNAY